MLTPDQYGQLLAALTVVTRQCHSPEKLRITAEIQLARLVGQPVRVQCGSSAGDGPEVWCSAAAALDDQGQELLGLFTAQFRCLLAQARHCERLTMEALRDPLTGLFNRRAFDRDLKAALAWPTPATLVVLDIRQFKRINDTFGHVTGDRVLQSVALGLTACAPAGGQAYRLAGDEFALLGVMAASDLAAFPVALRVYLRGALGPHGSLILDIGAAAPEAGDSAGEWLQRADQAMYVDKRRENRRVNVQAAQPLPP